MNDVPSSELPLLTEIIDVGHTPSELPTLTEIVSRSPAELLPSADAPETNFASEEFVAMAAELTWDAPPENPPTVSDVLPERNISATDMQQLLDHFEAHLESVFTHKLNRHLEQLHHQAVKLAIAELKDELPELLSKVLNNTQSS